MPRNAPVSCGEFCAARRGRAHANAPRDQTEKSVLEQKKLAG